MKGGAHYHFRQGKFGVLSLGANKNTLRQGVSSPHPKPNPNPK